MIKKILITLILFMSACSLGPDYTFYNKKLKVFCLSECPPIHEVKNFIEQEVSYFEQDCRVDFDTTLNRFTRLEIHFWEELTEYTGASGRYWPATHTIEVQYPLKNWKDVLRHELGLAIAQSELGYVGERRKIEWYKCHRSL